MSQTAAWLLALSMALWAGPAPAQEVGAAAPAGEAQLVALAPYLARAVRLAAVDPLLSASLVPDAWIDSLLAGAVALEAEVAARVAGPEPPQRWPIGPWPTPASLTQTIEEADPASVAALYRALTPRVEARCGARGLTLRACERALRASGARLTARSVLDRAAGDASPAVTPTQRELARLGVPVVAALRERIHGVGLALWGASWRTASAR